MLGQGNPRASISIADAGGIVAVVHQQRVANGIGYTKGLGDILREEVGQDHHRAHIVCGGRAPVGLQSLCFCQGVSGTNGEVVGKGVW